MDRRSHRSGPLRGSSVAAVPVVPDARTDWVRLVVANLSRMILVTALGLALWSGLPRLIGWEPTTVVSGSMAPRIQIGDVVVARPAEPARLSAGQVLLVDDPDRRGQLRLHRFVERNPNGDLVLRGDANPGNDSSPVSPAAVHGVAVLRIPWAGLPGRWVAEGDWLRFTLLAAGLVLALVGTGRDRALRHGEPPTAPPGPPGLEPSTNPAVDVPSRREDEPLLPGLAMTAPPRTHQPSPKHGQGRGRHRPASTPLMRPILAGLAVVVAFTGLGTLAPAGAALSATVTNPGNLLTALPYYTCGAAVMAGTPYLYYRFDETSGSTTADSSGNGRTGTYRNTGGITQNQAGACLRDPGKAVALDTVFLPLGAGGFVAASGTSGAAPSVFTIQIWFKTTTNTGGRLIGFGTSSTGTSSNDDRHLFLNNSGRVVFGVNPSGVQVIVSPATYRDGSWHLATATLSTAGMQLFMDGSLVATNAGVTSAQSISGYWRVGYDSLSGWGTNTPSTSAVTATVDDAAVFTTALSASAVKAIYDSGR